MENAFPFQVLSYEGRDFYFQDKAEKQYKVNFEGISSEDQKYLIAVAQEGKIPKGDPRFILPEEAPVPTDEPATASEMETKTEDENVELAPSMADGKG